MNVFRASILAAALLAAPAVVYAQHGSVSRDAVREELVQLENAGYNHMNGKRYPIDIQAAEPKLEAARSSFGSDNAGHSESGSGRPRGESPNDDLYRH